MKKTFLLIIFLLTLPIVSAECGITNLADCLPEKLIEYTITIFNAPIELLLQYIQNFLTEPVNIEPYKDLWSIVMYILSIFYGLFLLFAGYTFIVSGGNIIKRETAKEWLKNIILMIIFIQASYFLYQILIEIGASLSAGIINMIDPSFFLLTADSIDSIGLQFLFTTFYIITLVTTLIFLFIRYFLVSLGLVLFPIGLFLYFIPPLKSYGKLILEGLIILILLPFFQSLILLMGSKLLELSLVADLKILVMMCSFALINLFMIFLILFAAIKAVSHISSVSGSVAYVVKYFAV